MYIVSDGVEFELQKGFELLKNELQQVMISRYFAYFPIDDFLIENILKLITSKGIKSISAEDLDAVRRFCTFCFSENPTNTFVFEIVRPVYSY
jgi:hypothetical protein